jgi:FMN phosphatase YigB (HAD superfamily)
MKRQKKLIVFDLDGTLYELSGGSYEKSSLRSCVLKNAQNYIATKLTKNKSKALRILKKIQKEYGEQISIGLEKEFGVDRYDYFNTVWDIPARGIVKKEQGLRDTLLELRKKYNLALLSDAPQVWIYNVLQELKIQDIFRNNIFSGEGGQRKEFGNAFSGITRVLKISPDNCIVVGDQEQTDIIPAKKFGMRAIYVHPKKKSNLADANIKSICELPALLGHF